LFSFFTYDGLDFVFETKTEIAPYHSTLERHYFDIIEENGKKFLVSTTQNTYLNVMELDIDILNKTITHLGQQNINFTTNDSGFGSFKRNYNGDFVIAMRNLNTDKDEIYICEIDLINGTSTVKFERLYTRGVDNY